MKTRYTRSLETEVARRRAENRALLNSILGIAGVPPIAVPVLEEDGDKTDERARGVAPRVPSGSAVAGPRHDGRANPSVRLPVRKRTWYQINRSLEIEETRKKAREAAEAPELGVAVQRS